jgi:hypothetical protein
MPYVIAQHDNPEDVAEVTAAGVSALVLPADTFEAGLRFLRPGVTEHLDEYAYAKLCETLLSAVGSGRTGGAAPAEGTRDPQEVGRISASLRPADRTRVVERALAALQEGGDRAAYITRLLPAALPEDGVNPTELQGRAADAVARLIAGDRADSVVDALRDARSYMSLSFYFVLRSALDKTSPDAPGASLVVELREELASVSWFPGTHAARVRRPARRR